MLGGKERSMTDDIVTRLRQAYKNADEVASVFLANEAADEIQQLVTQLRIQAEVVNGKNYHTISGGLHLDAADEIEQLRKDNRELLEIVKLFADYGQCVIADEFGDCVHIDGACEWHSTEHLWESFCMARGI